jgi:hypothetical protein
MSAYAITVKELINRLKKEKRPSDVLILDDVCFESFEDSYPKLTKKMWNDEVAEGVSNECGADSIHDQVVEILNGMGLSEKEEEEE